MHSARTCDAAPATLRLMEWRPKYFVGLRGGTCDNCRAPYEEHREIAGLRFCDNDDQEASEQVLGAEAAKTRADVANRAA